VADATGTTVWRWDQAEPFGNNPADENPSGLGAFDLPLRLPGQRYDAETGLHYNYFRDYDPSIGRYGESDPIGLRGGLNTFAYVRAKPVSSVDPLGLLPVCIATPRGLVCSGTPGAAFPGTQGGGKSEGDGLVPIPGGRERGDRSSSTDRKDDDCFCRFTGKAELISMPPLAMYEPGYEHLNPSGRDTTYYVKCWYKCPRKKRWGYTLQSTTSNMFGAQGPESLCLASVLEDSVTIVNVR